MLHWLAGAKQPDGLDHDTSAVIDAPETPAPVFAVRAFKHALFGTPQQTSQSPRRHSTNEREKQRPGAGSRVTRPQITRPNSAGDAAALGRQQYLPEPMASPTKGILMTPGTAAARRKTVTFGDHVVDNAKQKVKDGSKTGLPIDFPGKFPSPWIQPAEKTDEGETPNDRKRSRSKLTEDLQKVRDESAKKKAAENVGRNFDDRDKSDDVEPDSESGRYWKKEYDMYRDNTTREVKKLIAKQRAAKSFARDKDLECAELAEQLRQEKKKVEKLEKRANELEAQLKALQAPVGDERSASPMRNARSTGRQSVLVGEGATASARPVPARSQSRDQSNMLPLESDLASRSTEREPRRRRERTQSVDMPTESAGVRVRARHQAGNLPSDLWSHGFASEGPATPSKAEISAVHENTRVGRTVTSGTDLTPLKSLSINAQHKHRATQQASQQRSLDAERPPASTPAFLRDNPTLAPPGFEAKDSGRCDSLDLETGTKAKTSSEKLTTRYSPLLPSSPFDPDGRLPPLPTTTIDKPLPPRPTLAGPTDSKENVSPSRATYTGLSGAKEDVPDVPVPRVGVTVSSIRAKDGTEVSEDRLAAAKARLAARGRKIS